MSAVIFLGDVNTLRDLTTDDFKTVEIIMSQLNKLHFENRPNFYLNNKQSITIKEYKSLLRNSKKIALHILSTLKMITQRTILETRLE